MLRRTFRGDIMGISLDLNKAHRHRVHGQITCIFTWMKVGADSPAQPERAMVLIATHRNVKTPWFIVMESAAFKYDDPVYLAHQAKKACEVMGIEPSRSGWFGIAKIIHDGLEDLIRMPSAPEPDYIRKALGSMQLRADGQILAQQDIRLEQEGAEYGVQ